MTSLVNEQTCAWCGEPITCAGNAEAPAWPLRKGPYVYVDGTDGDACWGDDNEDGVHEPE